MFGLSVLYVVYRHVPLIDAMFFGVKAAVLAVVVEAVLRIGRRALKNRVMISIAVTAFLGIYLLRIPFPIIILAAGLVGWLGSRHAPAIFVGGGHGGKGAVADTHGVIDRMFERGQLTHAVPSTRRTIRVVILWLAIWLAPVLLLWLSTGGSSLWTQLGTFFATMGVVTFGGAYAVLTYVAQAAVDSFGWLAPGEMVDGLGLAETTPGPLILVLQFVGFLAAYRAPGTLDPLVAGGLGALLTTWVVFAPSFLFIFAGAPYAEALRGNRAVSAALSAITAAVVGVVMNLALWFAIHVVFREVRAFEFFGVGPELPVLSSIDWRAALLAAAAMVAMLRFKVGMIPTLAVCAAAGVGLQMLRS
jgi:chromate transporter